MSLVFQAQNGEKWIFKLTNEVFDEKFKHRCGPGNTAKSYDDLGSDAEVDKCCRFHDYCDNIAAGEEKHGLRNDDMFTRLHCKCDSEFKQCLQSVNSKSGNYIGNVYFSFRDQCYDERHPVIGCEKVQTG